MEGSVEGSVKGSVDDSVEGLSEFSGNGDVLVANIDRESVGQIGKFWNGYCSDLIPIGPSSGALTTGGAR